MPCITEPPADDTTQEAPAGDACPSGSSAPLPVRHCPPRKRVALLALLALGLLGAALTMLGHHHTLTAQVISARTQALEQLDEVLQAHGINGMKRDPDDWLWPLRLLAEHMPETDPAIQEAWWAAEEDLRHDDHVNYEAITEIWDQLEEQSWRHDYSTSPGLNDAQRQQLQAIATFIDPLRQVLRTHHNHLTLGLSGSLAADLAGDTITCLSQWLDQRTYQHAPALIFLRPLAWTMATQAMLTPTNETALADLDSLHAIVNRQIWTMLHAVIAEAINNIYDSVHCSLLLGQRLDAQQRDRWLNMPPRSGPRLVQGHLGEILVYLVSRAEKFHTSGLNADDRSLCDAAWYQPWHSARIQHDLWQTVAVTCDIARWLQHRDSTRHAYAELLSHAFAIFQSHDRQGIADLPIAAQYGLNARLAIDFDTRHLLVRMAVSEALGLGWQAQEHGHAYPLVSHNRADGTRVISIDTEAALPLIHAQNPRDPDWTPPTLPHDQRIAFHYTHYCAVIRPPAPAID